MFLWIMKEVANASPTGLALGLSYWALKWSACLCGSFVLLLVCFLSLARRKQLESLKQLEHLAGKREVLPFLNLYILFKACSQPDNPAGFGPRKSRLPGYRERESANGSAMQRSALYLVNHVVYLLRRTYQCAKTLHLSIILRYIFFSSGSTGDKWRSRRRIFTPAFHFRILEDFIFTINIQSMILARILEKTSLQQNGVDVVPKAGLCTLDIVCETIMGKTLSAQSNEDSVYVEAITRLSELFMERMATPHANYERLYRMTAKGKEFTHWLNKQHAFTSEVIAERKKDMKATINSGFLLGDEDDNGSKYMKRKRPFLDTLLLEHFKDSKNITEEDMREEVDTFMLAASCRSIFFAGHDTTAMGISWALFLIGLSPVEQQKIHDELDSIFWDDTERHVCHEDMKEMRYLECALKESQRIYSTVPFYSRLCEEPFELGGTILPKGTVIKIANYFLHRDPEVFPKPEEFRPERFLPENSKGRHPFAYVPFSAGPRNCIGQKFSLSVVKIVVANILRRNKLQSLDHRDQVLLIAEMVLRPKNGLRIKLIPRTSSKALCWFATVPHTSARALKRAFDQIIYKNCSINDLFIYLFIYLSHTCIAEIGRMRRNTILLFVRNTSIFVHFLTPTSHTHMYPSSHPKPLHSYSLTDFECLILMLRSICLFVFSYSTGDKWRSRRRLFTPAFHFRILEDFSFAINSHSMVLADILGNKSFDHNGVDVVPKVTLCTLDIVCETIMGKVLNAQSNEDLAYVKALIRLSELFLERALNPLADFESIYRMTAKGKQYNHCLDILHAFKRQVIAERKEDMKATVDTGSLLSTEDDNGSNFTKQKRPFLDLLLLEHFKDGKNITEEDIREEVDTFILVFFPICLQGHDTTAVGVSWALFLIGLSPVEQQKIHDELDSIFGDDTERHVITEDMKEMRYLECVIKESQQLYPSVPFYSRLCEEPFELGGTMLPKGTVVQVSNYFLHRDPKVFPKPEEFRPDRFLPENSKGRHPFA
ncbi:unnamed protein product [Ixodes persulcatus]